MTIIPIDRKAQLDALVDRVNCSRGFPVNTCAASRHAQEIGEMMIRSDDEDTQHAGESILETVKALYDLRSERIAKRTEKVAK